MEAAEQDTISVTWEAAKNPWRRYGARLIDVYVFGELTLGIAGLMIGLWGPDWLFDWVTDDQQWKQLLVWSPLLWICATPMIATVISWKGTTPGKWLFGLRVVGDGPIRFGAAFRRECLLLFWGIGLALPLLNLVMAIRSFSEVEPTGVARWDEATGLRVEARTITGWRIVGVVIGTVLVVTALLAGIFLRILSAANR
ncbi:MAG: RDD family protein [Sphingomonas sp.]|nr:RDD family protein [Sphingomonas sp.]